MFNIKFLTYLVYIINLSIIFSGCGSSGGGDDFVGAAQVSIRVSPREFDTADRTQVTINISRASDTGISMKIFYPSILEYVPASAFIIADGVKKNVTPLYNESDGDEGTYLVFFIAISELNKAANGELTFQLSALDLLENGKIQIDADIDDPLIDNSIEFDPLDPKFASESEATVIVRE